MTSFTINNSDTTISCLKYLYMVYVCVHCSECMQVHVETRVNVSQCFLHCFPPYAL